MQAEPGGGYPGSDGREVCPDRVLCKVRTHAREDVQIDKNAESRPEGRFMQQDGEDEGNEQQLPKGVAQGGDQHHVVHCVGILEGGVQLTVFRVAPAGEFI